MLERLSAKTTGTNFHLFVKSIEKSLTLYTNVGYTVVWNGTNTKGVACASLESKWGEFTIFLEESPYINKNSNSPAIRMQFYDMEGYFDAVDQVYMCSLTQVFPKRKTIEDYPPSIMFRDFDKNKFRYILKPRSERDYSYDGEDLSKYT